MNNFVFVFSTEESENRVHAEEKWPCEHIGNVSLCNSVSKNKRSEEDEITSTPRVSLDRDHSVSV